MLLRRRTSPGRSYESTPNTFHSAIGGFGTPSSFPVCGEVGRLPVERVVRYGSYAVIARPVLWKGRLTKVDHRGRGL